MLSACNRKRELPGFDTQVLVPLVNTSIGFDKLIADSNATVNPDKSIDVVYRYPLYSYTMGDVLKVPDTSVTVSAKLATANLSNSFLERRISLGEIAKSLGVTGSLIIALHGSTSVIPPIPTSTPNQVTPIDANSFFREADITSGFLDATIKNDLPIGISNVEFRVTNKTDGQLVFRDTFSLIGPGDSATRSYNMAGKHVEGNLEATLVSLGSPGSNGIPVPIDTNKAIILQLKVRNLTASKATAIFPKQDLVKVDDTIVYALGKPQIKKMLIRSGKVKMQLFSTLQDTLYIDYKIPSAFKNNDTVHMYLKVPPAAPGGVQSIIQEVDLHDYTIDLRGRSGLASNSFWNIFRASIDSTGKLIQLSTSDSVWIRYGLYDIIPEFAEGYLGQENITASIGLFKSIRSGILDLKDINVKFTVENSIGANASLNFNYFNSKNTAKGSVITLSSPQLSSPFAVAKGNRVGYTAQTVTSSMALNTTNSNIKPFIENLPDEVYYSFNATINPAGNNGFTDFISYSSSLKAFLELQMPLAFKASQLTLADTVAFSLNQASTNYSVSNGILNFIFENNFPITFSSRIYFTDSNYNVIDSVFGGAGAIINPGPLDQTTLRTTGFAKTILSMAIDAAKTERLKRASHAIIRSSLNTSGSNYLKLYNDYQLKLKITGEFTYHAGKR